MKVDLYEEGLVKFPGPLFLTFRIFFIYTHEIRI